MASISPTTLSCGAEPYSGLSDYLKLTITSITDSDAATNKRYVGWKLTVEGSPWSTLTARYASLGGHEIVPLTVANVYNWRAGDILNSGSETYDNDSSGNLTLYAYVKQLFYYGYSATRWNNGTAQAADTNMVCSQLPRYANFTKFEVSSTEINKINITWGVDANCDIAQYQLNGGAWQNAAWPSFTISGLSPNTQYRIKMGVRRQDSQMLSYSSTIYGTTKALPTSNTPSNFNLGSSPTASISNTNYLSSWKVEVYDGVTLLATESNITTTSKVIDLTNQTLISNMLSRHTSDNSWAITFKYYCTSNGVNYTLTERTCTCTITANDYKPVFTDSNISYVVTDQQSLDLTGSNKKVIKGISDIEITLTPASPQGSATMVSYTATSGSSSDNTTSIQSPVLNLTNVDGNSMAVQAIDSRNKSTSVTKAYDTYVDYFAPTISTVNINRIDGIGTNLRVNITGLYCDWSNLATTNIIEQVSIEYKKISDVNYTTITGISLTITNNNGTFTITGDITGNYFSAAYEYDLLITLKDKIITLPLYQFIHAGSAFIWKDLSNKYIGINKKPAYDLDIDGDVNISGNYLINGDPIGTGGGGDSIPIGTIVPYGSSTLPDGWLLCDGSAISRTAYSTLFTKIGTAYGVGDGSTTFNLPNLKGRVPVGLDSNQGEFDALGETGGEKYHTLIASELPSQPNYWGYAGENTDWPLVSNLGLGTQTNCEHYVNVGGAMGSGTTSVYTIRSSGANHPTTHDQGHLNLQPYQVTNYIIKALNINTDPNVVDSLPIGSILDYDGNTVPEGYSQVEDEMVILYSDATGSNTTVTLSDSLANYTYAEIIYRSNDGTNYKNSTGKIWNPNDNHVTMTYWFLLGHLYLKYTNAYLDGTSITLTDSSEMYWNFSTNTFVQNSSNNIYIVQVIGYR